MPLYGVRHTVGDTVVGATAAALIDVATAGKAVVDAGVYVGAVWVCSEQQ